MAESQQRVLNIDLNKMCEEIEDFDSGDKRNDIPEQGFNGQKESDTKENNSLWGRARWTTDMVKLLITAVSCATSFDPDVAGRIELPDMSKEVISKWKAISMVMVGRGYMVSPLQCENKFNDLYKKYKRLNALLGNGACCNVVDDPRLLETMELPPGTKEKVKRILSFKQLFYQEMCLYHNKNRLFLDAHVERSNNPNNSKMVDECRESNDGFRAKEKRLGHTSGVKVIQSPSSRELNEGRDQPVHASDLKQTDRRPLDGRVNANKSMLSQWQNLQKLKLYNEEQRLELEKCRLQLLEYNKEQDKKLDEMRWVNEQLRQENLRLQIEIKRRETC